MRRKQINLGHRAHFWPLVVKLFTAKRFTFPDAFASIGEKQLRHDCEIALASEVVSLLEITALMIDSDSHNEWHNELDDYAVKHAEIMMLKDTLNWLQQEIKITNGQLHDYTRFVTKHCYRARSVQDSNNFIASSEAYLGLLFEKNKSGQESKAYLMSLNDKATNLHNEISAIHEKIECTMRRNGYSDKNSMEISENLSRKFNQSLRWNPVISAITSDMWWRSIREKLLERMTADYIFRGNQIIIRRHQSAENKDETRAIIGNKSKVRQDSDKVLEKIYNDIYINDKNLATGNDGRIGKHVNHVWNLPQLRQTLRNQDQKVNAWFCKKDAETHPLHPKYDNLDDFNIRSKRDEFETGLYWILERKKFSGAKIKDWGRGILMDRPSCHNFEDTILSLESLLLVNASPGARLMRLNAIQSALTPEY